MTKLQTVLLDEVERLQEEILRLQSVIEGKQNENDELAQKYEKLQKAKAALYYEDLANKFAQELENILSAHKNELNLSENKLESLESEQAQIEAIKSKLNQLLTSGESDYSATEYRELLSKYESLQTNYESLENELTTIKTILKESLEDMKIELKTEYNKLTNDMAQHLENAWKAKLKELLPLVDMKLNESLENPNAKS